MGDSYTIQVSANLVNKLARDAEGPKKRTRKSKPKIPEVAPKQQNEKPHPSPATPMTVPNAAWPVQNPMFLPVPPPIHSGPALPELEAIRSVLHECESVLKKLEEKEAHMTQELTQRAKELRDKEFKLPSQKYVPCEAEREACRQCYQENAKQPLKCAEFVRSFEDCARRARQQRQQQEGNSPV